MYDPFHLPRRFLRSTMTRRYFPTRQRQLHLWVGLLNKDLGAQSDFDVEQDAYSAMWLLRGEYIYRDAEVGEIRASAGDLLCRLPNRRHSTIPVEGSGLVELFIHLDAHWFRQLSAIGAVPDRPHARLGWDPGLADRCIAFLERLPSLQDASWPLALADAQSLLASFTVGCDRGGVADEAMAEACAILSSDLPGHISLAGVARRLGLGTESFRKRFAAATGQSPGAWRIQRRIDAACAYLLAGNAPLSEVAASLGYVDVPTFSKQFRRATGQPPAAWRRGQKSG